MRSSVSLSLSHTHTREGNFGGREDPRLGQTRLYREDMKASPHQAMMWVPSTFPWVPGLGGFTPALLCSGTPEWGWGDCWAPPQPPSRVTQCPPGCGIRAGDRPKPNVLLSYTGGLGWQNASVQSLGLQTFPEHTDSALSLWTSY